MYLRLIFAALLGLIAAAMVQGQDRTEVSAASIVVSSSGAKVSTSDQILKNTQAVSLPTCCPPASTCACAGKCCCSKEEKGKLAAAAKGAYKGVYYANDFSYLNDPCYDGSLLGESLKEMPLGQYMNFSVGGEYRTRFHNEGGMQGTPGRVNSFLLQRSRLYGDLKFGEFARIFVEGIDAQSNYEVLAPRGIDENRWDFLNAFGDLRLMNTDKGSLTVRAGRQELLYGAQRTVSPLDWANIRRTFEGYKLFWKGKDWNVDGFFANPMLTNVNAIDSANRDQQFYGVYSSYKGIPDWAVDLYYLGLNNDTAGFNYNTWGMRMQGAACGLLYDVEGAYQGGNDGASNHDSGFFTLGMGKKFADVPGSPTFFAYYDWAGGAHGGSQGYNHLFPLAHKYLGFMDFFGRRNLEDFNFQMVASPAKKLKFLMWYHIFNRATVNDTPYSVAMTPFGGLAGGRQLGQELDTALSYNISPRSDIVLGYSHFFAGQYFDVNPGLAFSNGADFVYTQFSMKF